MEIKTQGTKIQRDKFEQLWNEAFTPDFDPTKGLGKIQIGKSRILFVKDDTTGAVCCYVQQRYYGAGSPINSNAYFVRKAEKDVSDSKLEIHFADTKKVNCIVNLSDTGANEVAKTFEDMLDVAKNPEFIKLYDEIKTKFGVLVDPKDDLESYEILVPPTFKAYFNGARDKEPAYIVCAPHPNRPTEKSLYFLASLKKADGTAIDLGNPTEILNNGGLVVNRIRTDKNNEIKIDYYKGKDKKALFSIKAVDKAHNIKAWVEGLGEERFKGINPGENKKVVVVKPSYKTRKIVTLAVTGILALSTILIPTSGLTGKDYSEDAYSKGVEQVETFLNSEEIQGQNLFQYENEMPVKVGGLHALIQKDIQPYRHSGWGWGKDYTKPTIEGAASITAMKVVEELIANNVVVSKYNAESQKFESIVYYPASPTDSSASLVSKEAGIAYLVNEGFTKDEAQVYIESYEKAYQEKVKEALSKDGTIGGNENPEPQPEGPVINVEATDVKVAITSAITKFTPNSGKIEPSNANLAYVNYDETNKQVLFVGSGNYLYEIDLTNNGQNTSEITNDQELVSRIMETKNVTESVKASVLFKKLKCDASLQAFADAYNHDNGVSTSEFYISNMDLNQSENMIFVSPKLTAVRDGGKSIERRELDSVSVDPKEDASLTQMVALSMLSGFGYTDKEGIYIVIVSKNPESVVYEDNDLKLASTDEEVATKPVSLPDGRSL